MTAKARGRHYCLFVPRWGLCSAVADQHKNKIRLNAHDKRQKSPTVVKNITRICDLL